MSKSQKKRPLEFIKRGLISLFVCAVVAFPLYSVYTWARSLNMGDSRKATPLQAMVVRPADKKTQPVYPFGEALISVTFDDGWESIYTVAAPILNKHGVRTTQYVLSGVEDDIGYMSWKQLEQLHAGGHELACHSVVHPDLTTLDDEDLDLQLANCQKTLALRVTPVYDFASPYGAVNDRTLGEIKKYYRSQRNTEGDASNGINEADVNVAGYFDIYQIIAVTVHRDTKVEDLKKLVDYSKAHKGWLVLNYHQVDEGPSKYGLDPKVLEEQISYLASTDVRIVTMGQVLEQIAPVHLPEF